MRNILILVDMQNGFCKKEYIKVVAERIEELLGRGLFDYVISTEYVNYDNSTFEKLIGWHGLKNDVDIKLYGSFANYANEIVEKTIYSCVNNNFIQRLCQINDGTFPKKVFLIGVDTDCCVLKTAVDLFEYNIRPIVLTNYCSSCGGPEAHLAGLTCLRRLIGEKQLFTGQISSRDTLDLI